MAPCSCLTAPLAPCGPMRTPSFGSCRGFPRQPARPQLQLTLALPRASSSRSSRRQSLCRQVVVRRWQGARQPGQSPTQTLWQMACSCWTTSPTLLQRRPLQRQQPAQGRCRVGLLCCPAGCPQLLQESPHWQGMTCSAHQTSACRRRPGLAPAARSRPLAALRCHLPHGAATLALPVGNQTRSLCTCCHEGLGR